jgi:DnaJ-class molecular chaperone
MLHECFADEIAIDFPSVGRVVERMRDRFLGEANAADTLSAEVCVSPSEASRGLVVPLDVPIRTTCARCGGRGETWTERCADCSGSGESLVHHAVRLSVPAGVADGARFRFRLTAPDASSVRVEVRVAIRPAAI